MSVVGKPGYKETEIGWISKEWVCTTLGEICSGKLQTGPFGSQLHADEYQDDGVPVLMPKDLVGYRANLTSAAKVAPSRAAELAKHVLKSGDLLFSRRGDVTRFALIDELSEGALCGTGCLKATPASGHVPAYLSYFLQLDSVRNWLEQNAVGQTMPNMNTGILASLPLATPPTKSEKEKIAAILATVDDKLDVIARRAEATQALKRGLMQTLFSRGVGTKDADGRWLPHSRFKNSELGEIPAGWEVRAIGDVFSVVERPIKMDDGQPYRRVTVKRRHGGIELRDELLGAEIKVKNQYLLESGDFLISERQIVHGACGIVPDDLDGALVSNEYLVLKARDGFDATYFSYLVQLLKYAKLFLLCSQGVDIEKFLFKPKDWLKKRIPVPPFIEQQRIAEILLAVEAKTIALGSKQSQFQALKRGLMQKLLTGEWRVKVETTVPEAEPEVTA